MNPTKEFMQMWRDWKFFGCQVFKVEVFRGQMKHFVAGCGQPARVILSGLQKPQTCRKKAIKAVGVGNVQNFAFKDGLVPFVSSLRKTNRKIIVPSISQFFCPEIFHFVNGPSQKNVIKLMYLTAYNDDLEPIIPEQLVNPSFWIISNGLQKLFIKEI